MNKFLRSTKNVLLIGIFLFILPSYGQEKNQGDPKPLGKLVDIGGWKLHVYEQGKSFKGGPSVVLEAGAGDFSFVWSLVQPKVAEFARVYSYDRAGSAWSDIGPSPHTIAQSIYDLHTLLLKVRAPKPYILVGHSLGGLIIRLFAEKYPDEVGGIVIVDGGIETGKSFINGKRVHIPEDAKGIAVPEPKVSASPADNEIPDEAAKAIRSFMKQVGLPAAQVDPPYNKLPLEIQQLQLWATGQVKNYVINNDFSVEELASAYTDRQRHPNKLGQCPVCILTRGKIDSTDLKYEEERMNAQKSLLLLSHNSKQIIVYGSGHAIHLEYPEVVINAIKEQVLRYSKN